jgi:hypothetical protein
MTFGVEWRLLVAPNSVTHLNNRTLAVGIYSYPPSSPCCTRFEIGDLISSCWQTTHLANVNHWRMMDGNRRSIVCLAALAAAADVRLPSDDEGVHVHRAGSYPRVRTTFVDATRYLPEVEFTRAFRMSPDCFGKLLFVLRVPLERDKRQGYRS